MERVFDLKAFTSSHVEASITPHVELWNIITSIMENQVEKNMDNDIWKLGSCKGFFWG